MKQKIRFMSMLLATSATALSAGAADWKVNINPVALNPGDTVCIQNVATGRYLTGGEAWGTQAVVGPISSASRCILVLQDDGTYQVKNDVRGWGTDNPNTMYRQPNEGTVGAGVKTCFVDYSNVWSLKAAKWAVAEAGNNTYTFQVPHLDDYNVDENSTPADSLQGYVDGEFLGVNRTHETKIKGDGITWGLYYDVSYADSAANCQFQFLPANITQAKGKLYAAMVEAEAAGVDVTAYAALLANADATVEDVLAAVPKLADAIEDLASPDNPRDVGSKYLTNTKPIAKGTPAGWTVLKPDGTAGETGDTSDGVGEFWSKQGYTLKTTIKNFPGGVYRFKAIALTRDGMATKFFVGTDTINIATVTSNIVNSRAQAATWFNTDDDGDGVNNGTNVITVVLPQDTDITIGLTAASTGDGWTVWREFQIESYGRGVETFHYVNQGVLDQLNEIKDDEFNFYTASLMDEAINVATAGVEAATKEEASAYYVQAQQKLQEVKDNVAAWASLKETADQAEEDAYQLNNGEAVTELTDQAHDMLDALTASTAEVLAMIENITKTLEECQKGSYTVGDDVTYLIKNPTFNDTKAENNYQQPQSTQYWTGANVIGAGWVTDTRLAEVYNQDCNIHQDLTGLQKGAYRLSIQAFYRSGFASPDGYQNYLNGDSLTKAYIYMGLTQQRVKSIYACTFPESVTSLSRENHWVNVGSDDAPLYIPNTMDESYVAFNGSVDADQDPTFDDNYRNVVYGVVTEAGGSMPIGFKIEGHNDGSWVIFRDFRLEYMGNNPDYVKPVLVNKINEANNDYVGQKMTAEHKNALTTAVANGQAAIDAKDGDAMMNAFTAIADAEKAADVSIAAYKKLQASYDSLKTEFDDATQASEEARAQATNLLNEVSGMIENGTIDVDDIPAKQKEMLLARKALMVQPGSDDAPSKYTGWIVNPNYEDKLTGWTVNKTAGDGNPGANFNTAEIWNATANVYQDIEGLPEGTYEVHVQSFFRPVSAAEAWADLLGDSIENYGERATVYANWDSITPNYWCSKYDPDLYSWTIGGYSDMVDSVYDDVTGELMPITYHLANNQEAAEYQFQTNYYPVQTFYTYVGANGLLRLGFKNTAHKPQDWFVVSNWELYYHGKDSQYGEATGIRDLETNDNVNFNEVYTVDGRRVNGLQKGLNIVRGKNAEGKVVTKKIVVK